MDPFSHMPFLLTTVKAHFNFPRLLESALIAVVTAVVVNYTALQVLGTRIDALESRVQALQSSLDSMRHDLYIPRGK